MVLRHIAFLAACLCSCGRSESEGVDPSLIRVVQRNDLSITVRERGEIKAARDTRVSSELEGRATLIYLIPEGTVVAQGDRLAELDVSAIEEKRAQQAISVVKAEAALEQARKSMEIAEKELEAEERTAETRQQVARLREAKFLGEDRSSGEGSAARMGGTNEEMFLRLGELLEGEKPDSPAREKYAGLPAQLLEMLGPEENRHREMGEMANQVLTQINEINLARADLELAAQTLYYSKELQEKGFITTNELDKDQINYQRQLSAQTLAWNNLLLLVHYTLPEEQISLGLEVENAGLNLESVRAASEARRVKEAAELKSAESEYDLAREQLENWESQIQHGILRAPAPGLVVYGRMDWDEPVYEGMEVRERQELIILPDVTSMMVELKVPEAQIGRLVEGQTASIRVDAFPGKDFTGKVSHVSRLPDPSPFNQLLKVYIARVLIDGENGETGLRPGMNGTVTIEVETMHDVLNVPLPALERRGDTHYVWKLTPSGPAATEVELGGNNLTDVQVLAGLDEGDRIYLVRPPGSQLPPDVEEVLAPEQAAELGQAKASTSPASADAGTGSQ
jgi:HlyD family secretion protein